MMMMMMMRVIQRQRYGRYCPANRLPGCRPVDRSIGLVGFGYWCCILKLSLPMPALPPPNIPIPLFPFLIAHNVDCFADVKSTWVFQPPGQAKSFASKQPPIFCTKSPPRDWIHVVTSVIRLVYFVTKHWDKNANWTRKPQDWHTDFINKNE